MGSVLARITQIIGSCAANATRIIESRDGSGYRTKVHHAELTAQATRPRGG
jgi:hypothetical protein